MSRVDALWARMLALFGHTWASQYGTVPEGIAADTWASALAGITPEQLADGLRNCVAEGREFPPSAGRFRAMCLGVPSFAAVKAELLTRDAKRSPFVILVWSYVDAHRVRTSDSATSDRLLQAAYELAREKVMRGEPLPQAPIAELEHDEPPAPKPASPARAAEALAEARELLGPAAKPKPEPSPTQRKPTAQIERELEAHYAALGKSDELADHLPQEETP